MRTGARFPALASPAGLAAVLLLLGVSAPVDPAVEPTANPAVAILEVVVSPDPVRSGKPVSVTIHTTPNVVLLQGRVMGHNFTVPKTADGVFYGRGKVPWWARFLHGAFNVVFTAIDENGDASQMEQTVHM
jgi:hypothetical protein